MSNITNIRCHRAEEVIANLEGIKGEAYAAMLRDLVQIAMPMYELRCILEKKGDADMAEFVEKINDKLIVAYARMGATQSDFEMLMDAVASDTNEVVGAKS